MQILKADDKRVIFIKKQDKILADFINKKGDIEYYLNNEPIKFIIFSIIGQLISTKVANKIMGRSVELCHNDFSVENLIQIDVMNIKNLGLTMKKATYINSFIEYIAKQPNFFNELKTIDDKTAIKTLTKLHGIGNWTAKMYLMFVLDREDVFPFEDLALIKGMEALYGIELRKKKDTDKFGLKWQPYRSIASRYIYEYADEVFKNKPNPDIK